MRQIKSKIRLYVVDEQEMYREVYKTFPSSKVPVELVGIPSDGDINAAKDEISTLSPDVLLLSTKRLESDVVETLEQIRMDNPGIGIVLLSLSYTATHITLLRKLAQRGEGGMALFLKQSLDQIEQLWGIVLAVSQGQVILDTELATSLFAEKAENKFLKQFTARELEILSLISKGYTNLSIAEALYIDVKTVEHHINSMYGKLRAEADFDDKHPRISAARLYLEATGQLLTPAMP